MATANRIVWDESTQYVTLPQRGKPRVEYRKMEYRRTDALEIPAWREFIKVTKNGRSLEYDMTGKKVLEIELAIKDMVRRLDEEYGTVTVMPYNIIETDGNSQAIRPVGYEIA